ETGSKPSADTPTEPAETKARVRTERPKVRRQPRKSKKVAKPATEKNKTPDPEPAKKPRYDANSARLPGM
ncbi:MAG: hypothetical protein KUG77_05950, partial [Nannocystaceae bacterium]|nr:hypothetical protein [Nannocystaceae bacterium]